MASREEHVEAEHILAETFLPAPAEQTFRHSRQCSLDVEARSAVPHPQDAEDLARRRHRRHDLAAVAGLARRNEHARVLHGQKAVGIPK